ncbi:unnamed protein product [Spodoptera littoralis]|uniref:Palmitoyltransferase n=1 Tax=Spodoptera littoralis TaxID=7109 RepID=A0A9P0N8V1_SPOLI|nr:unnamed protein product [Spodoptera littoralis]CAH1644031.1 unnamed protein product [Spodoptera littoralis]
MSPQPRKSLIAHIFAKVQFYGVVFVLIPFIFVFQITIVYPELVRKLKVSLVEQIVHICLISFCFINVIGNLIYSIMMDSSLKRPVFGEGTYCEECRMVRPVRSWHCMQCNVCIVKRDHHCSFLSRCVGLYNQRYFVLFLGHVMLSMTYATYYNYYFVTMKFKGDGWALSAFRIFNPLLRFIIPEPMGYKDVYLFFLIMNVALIVWSGTLFYWHFKNVLMGVTSYEARFPELKDASRWKQNLRNVFGTKWYLAIICPMCESPLPEEAKYV